MKPDSPAELITMATDIIARVQRVAVRAGPEARFRLMGELALVAIQLDTIEEYVREAAKTTLKAVPTRHTQVKPNKRAAPLPRAATPSSDANVRPTVARLAQRGAGRRTS